MAKRWTNTHDFHAHYIRDEYNEAYRVWCSHHPQDQFELIPVKEFPIEFVESYTHMFVKGFPEDDDGTLQCERCKRNNGE